MIRRVFWYSSICIACLMLDQYTKHLVLSYMMLGESIEIIPHFMHLTYVRNYGAVFGFLNNAETQWQFWIFMGAIVGVCYFVISMLRSNPKNHIIWLSSALLLAGGFGNTIDRLQYKYVVDFFDFFIQSYHWPAFNFADCYIIISIILLLFEPYLIKIIKEENA